MESRWSTLGVVRRVCGILFRHVFQVSVRKREQDLPTRKSSRAGVEPVGHARAGRVSWRVCPCMKDLHGREFSVVMMVSIRHKHVFLSIGAHRYF